MTAVSRAATVLRVTSGNFLEMYDFFLFGLFASDIAAAFFPAKSELASLLLTFATFGAGFLMRPLGAIFLGAYVDRVGRRQGLIVTLSIMGLGIALVAFVPAYAQIGLLAPLLVLIGRLLQGFSAGVELGGVSVYLAELATPGHKGFYVSWQSASQQVSIVVGALIGYAVNTFMAPDVVHAWGWRIPFFVGCLIVPMILVIRSSLQETAAFLARTERPTTAQIFASLAANWRIIGAGTLLVVMTTVSFYLITVYTPTYGKVVLKLPGTQALVITLCIGLSNLIWLPIAGALSDRIGRFPLLVGCTLLAVLTAYPALAWLVNGPTFGKMLAVELWLSLIYGAYNGAMIVALTEVVPERIRTAGFSLSYSLATALFGGFTPAVSTALIAATNNRAAPGWWLTFAALCGLGAALYFYRPTALRGAQSLPR
jgi:MFS transporter, MHS family, citrate/tricarballylate:H+ symporter